jgi:hypothetical protein
MAKRDSKKSLNAAELALLRDGNLIYAIKAYRERTGASLIDAKHLADETRATMPARPFPARLAGLAPRGLVSAKDLKATPPFNPPYRKPPEMTITIDALVLDGLMCWWAASEHFMVEPRVSGWQVRASQAAEKWLRGSRGAYKMMEEAMRRSNG